MRRAEREVLWGCTGRMMCMQCMCGQVVGMPSFFNRPSVSAARSLSDLMRKCRFHYQQLLLFLHGQRMMKEP